jgi:polyribonucleotide nucleotidyltransferase
MFKIVKKELEWGGRKLTIETGRLARQANASVLVTYGETSVLCCVTAERNPKDGIDFFPLTVNYIEKTYSAGKIPGGFFKREGKLSEKETLTSRLIDRPLRPMFDENYKNETQVVCTVLSYDKINDADIPALIGSSAALAISEIPFNDPIAAVKIGYINDEFILNPTFDELLNSRLDLTVAATNDSILMVESEVDNLTSEEMLEALKFAQEGVAPVVNLIKEIVSECGKEKWVFTSNFNEKLYSEIDKKFRSKFEKAFSVKEKLERQSHVNAITSEINESYVNEDNALEISGYIKKIEKDVVRNMVFNDQRIDGRSLDQVRQIDCQTNLFPRVHGSSLFTRGETQSLAFVTLGSEDDEQMIDALEGTFKERFMLHYNFPPFSVGEVGMLRAPGRREIGHGKLAKKSLNAILPSFEEFPYSIRVVSEILESNGSSSMASVCSASMSLMSAGVPIKEAVSGIAMGLVMDGKKYKILSDIMGDEDHLGDMDFKVAGTKNGITALQMDIKIKGITFEIFANAIKQADAGRQHILSEMNKAVSKPSENLGEYVPIMDIIKIKEDKIREVIGQGGKVIKKICEDSNCKISIEDNGDVKICAPDQKSYNIASDIINSIVEEPEIGKVYDGIVQKITDYGAFIGFLNSSSGLIHISEFSESRINNLSKFIAVGDPLKFKIIGRERDKLRLSYKAVNGNINGDDLPSDDDNENKNSERKSKKDYNRSKNNKYKEKEKDNDPKDANTEKKKKKGFFW